MFWLYKESKVPSQGAFFKVQKVPCTGLFKKDVPFKYRDQKFPGKGQ